jgi:hypothetical protein
MELLFTNKKLIVTINLQVIYKIVYLNARSVSQSTLR